MHPGQVENLDRLKKYFKHASRKYLIFSAFFIVFLQHGKSQFLEFGGAIGATTYAGDITRGYSLKNAQPGITLFNRMNLSEVVSLRYSVMATRVGGSDLSNPIDGFTSLRGQSFKSTLIDADIRFEYYFLDYLNEHSQIKWSPYFTLGIGFFRLFNNVETNGEFSKIQPSIPIGIGIKQIIWRRYSIGIEATLRKTFTDYIDNISDANDLSVSKTNDPNFGNPNDKDWYLFTGISFSYILYKIPCPFRYVPNSSILD